MTVDRAGKPTYRCLQPISATDLINEAVAIDLTGESQDQVLSQLKVRQRLCVAPALGLVSRPSRRAGLQPGQTRTPFQVSGNSNTPSQQM
jgi:hypothetical protein